MSATIRLKRLGTKKRPFYRIVVMDKREPRDGRTIDELGIYHPIEKADKQIAIDTQKAQQWIQSGAVVSATVRSLLNKKGILVTRTAPAGEAV